MKSIDGWINRLKGQDLPVLRRSIGEIGRLSSRSETITATETAAAILHDPLLTLKVLRLVNNISRGRLTHEITTVEQAVIMVGIGPFFSHLANLTAVEDILPKDALQGLLTTMSRAHHAAWQARDWGVFRADLRAEEVYIGALLYDMGELVLWCLAPEQALKIDRLTRRKSTMEEAQQAVLGFHLRELQLALASAWNLPELLRDFMDSGNAVHPRARGVVIAASIAHHAANGWHGSQVLADCEVMAGQLRLSLDEMIAIVHHNAVAEARHWEWYGVPPAAAWLPMLPGDWPKEEDETTADTEAEICLAPQPATYQQIMDEIAAHLDESLDLHGMMTLVLRGMREGVGLHRVVFALLTQDRTTLKAKYVVGGQSSPLGQFHFDLRTPNLFGRLLEKAQSVWLNDSNRSSIGPLIPAAARQVIGDGEFFAMSVFVRDKPVGLFYADRGRSGCTLDEHSYQAFKRLCLRAGEGLAHLAKK